MYIYIYMYVCTYVCMYVCIYIYIYIDGQASGVPGPPSPPPPNGMVWKGRRSAPGGGWHVRRVRAAAGGHRECRDLTQALSHKLHKLCDVARADLNLCSKPYTHP